jgi:hypothetical protein
MYALYEDSVCTTQRTLYSSIKKDQVVNVSRNVIEFIVRNCIVYCVGNVHRFLRLFHTYHAVPLPCRAAEGLDCVFPVWFTQCSRVWFTHAIALPCRARAMPRPCSESDFSRRHSAALARRGHGTAWRVSLASAVQRRHVGDLPAFGFFRLPRGVPWSLLSEAFQSVKL